MISWLPMGYDEALRITLEAIDPLGTEIVPLAESTGRIVAQSLISQINSPSIDASLKDGYAVMSGNLENASPESPIELSLTKSCSAAGGDAPLALIPGSAMRILTGARIPQGADAVLAEEFTSVSGNILSAQNIAEPGRNIMPKGTDVAKGQCVGEKGSIITPGKAGILAASGFSQIPVYKRPKVAIIATGDEVVAPGNPLPKGKLYASNMITLSAFCRKWGMETKMLTSKDDYNKIRETIEGVLDTSDAIITSGGAWTGDRDLVAKILSDLGWKKAFHRIRMGPGKAVGFGNLGNIPVFLLPGGPPSNLMGFLQMALPGLHALSGFKDPGLPLVKAAMSSDLKSRAKDWTQFVFGKVEPDDQGLRFVSLGQKSRLQSMAEATAIAAIPEGKNFVPKGEKSFIQVLSF